MVVERSQQALLPARYHLIGALVIDRLATNRGARVCVHASRRSRADCNELISAKGRGSAIFLSFTRFLPLLSHSFRMRFRTVQPFRPNSILTPFSAENDSRERSRYHREREREREIGLQGRAFQLVDSLTVQRKGWSLSIKELSYTFHDEYVF